VLDELEKTLGKLRIESRDPSVRVLLDGAPRVGSLPIVIHVSPGDHVVTAQRDSAEVAKVAVKIAARDTQTVTLEPPPAPAPDKPPAGKPGPDAPTSPPSLSHRFQLGITARADIEGRGRGVVGAFGLSFGVHDHMEIGVSALVGRVKGVEPAVTAFILKNAWKPMITVGVPVFFGDGGVWPAVRPGAGIQWDPIRHFGLFAQVAAAFFPKAPAGEEHVVFLPTVGAQGRIF
jgi:hypothetical protein